MFLQSSSYIYTYLQPIKADKIMSAEQKPQFRLLCKISFIIPRDKRCLRNVSKDKSKGDSNLTNVKIELCPAHWQEWTIRQKGFRLKSPGLIWWETKGIYELLEVQLMKCVRLHFGGCAGQEYLVKVVEKGSLLPQILSLSFSVFSIPISPRSTASTDAEWHLLFPVISGHSG